ncbi:MAG: adenylate/guanylate cyclase domain-containing protein [Cyanobacteriota bacterium]|nr:adenylate/guanylate cyclase domain-containing protein [Cyanobacteriota bacterium]
MTRRWYLLLAALFTALARVVLHTPLQQFDGWVADRMQEVQGTRSAPSDIVLLEYDEITRSQAAEADLLDQPALEDLQFWPLPRQVWGDVLDRLRQLEVRAVGFDVLFDEPRRGDEGFVAGLQRFGRPVVLAVGVDDADDSSFGLRSGLLRPHQGLIDASSVVDQGHIAVLGRVGGTVRETPRSYALIKQHLQALQLPPSLSERLHQLTGGVSGPVPSQRQWLDLIDFYGPPGAFRTLPLWDLMEQAGFQRLRSEEALKGATVLIANTTPEARDRHPTPFARVVGMPGVEIHATALANLREGQHLQVLLLRGWVPLALIAWAVGLAELCRRQERPAIRLLLGGLAVLSALLMAQLSLLWWSRLPPLGSWMTVSGLVGLLSAGEGTVRIQRSRRRMRTALSRYLSPAVMEDISRRSEDFDVTLGGEACDVVVLFTDVRGFTAKTMDSTKQGRVGAFVRQLNAYFTVVVQQLLSNNATVDKYIGDAVLAYFGAPIKRNPVDNARLAIDSAQKIVAAVEQLNQDWSSSGLVPWEQVIVLSYGSVICGNIGSPNRLDFTIIGDAVNCASRLEVIAKQFSVPIVATADVVDLFCHREPSECHGVFSVRGRDEPIEVFSVPAVMAS